MTTAVAMVNKAMPMTAGDATLGIRALTMEEVDAIAGGVDWGEVATGLEIAGAALFAIAALPEAAFVGAAYGAVLLASAASGAAAGIHIGIGLASD